MKRVLIATPSYDGKVDTRYANALVETVLLGLNNDIRFFPLYMAYDALVQRARNDLAAIALENNFDDVLWIDADMEWDPQWAIDLVLSEHDVIGLPVIKKSLMEAYNVKADMECFDEDHDGLYKVLSIGTGFLKTSHDALQHLWENSEAYVHNGQDRRWIFQVKIQDGDIISEDVLMCQTLRDGGFDIYIDPTKTCNHVGTLLFQGDFANFLERLKSSES